MLTVTSEYALRAMVFLAQHHEEQPIAASIIAAMARIPKKYLSKILADLVRQGLLTGARGKNGGFRMSRPAEQIRLAEVLCPFQSRPNPSGRNCPFGNATCNDEDPCAGHARWKSVNETFERFLCETSLGDVATKKANCGQECVGPTIRWKTA